MSLATYLTPRGKGGIYQLRVPIPRALHGPGKPRERIKSMGTADRRLASDRALSVLDGWKREWAAELAKLGKAIAEPRAEPRPVSVRAVLFEIAEQLDDQLEAARRRLPSDDATQDGHINKRAAELRKLTRRHLDGDDTAFREMADRIIANRSLPIERSTPAYDGLVAGLAEVVIDVLQTYQRRHHGEVNAEPQHPQLSAERERRANTAKPGETLLELYDAYRDWRCTPGRKGRRRPETFKQDRPAVELFSEFVGVDRSAASITKDDVHAFRTMLASFPQSRTKNKSLSSKSIVDCIEIARHEKLPLISLSTQAKYLSILSPFFDWLVSDAPHPIVRNPFNGLHIRTEKGRNRRPSYTTDELNKIVASPLFKLSGGSKREHLPGEVPIRDWRYWIPLLCIFTGSRITEIAQLHVDNIGVRDDVALIMIDYDEGDGQFVKGKRSRIAALHPILIAAGFLDYCAEQRDRASRDDNRQLFPELKPDIRGMLGAEPSRWFRRFLERIDVKHGADGRGAHSFRHTLTDAMREAGYMDVEFGQLILGHANNTITEQYGNLPQGKPARMREMIEAAFRAKPFAGVNFDHLTRA